MISFCLGTLKGDRLLLNQQTAVNSHRFKKWQLQEGHSEKKRPVTDKDRIAHPPKCLQASPQHFTHWFLAMKIAPCVLFKVNKTRLSFLPTAPWMGRLSGLQGPLWFPGKDSRAHPAWRLWRWPFVWVDTIRIFALQSLIILHVGTKLFPHHFRMQRWLWTLCRYWSSQTPWLQDTSLQETWKKMSLYQTGPKNLHSLLEGTAVARFQLQSNDLYGFFHSFRPERLSHPANRAPWQPSLESSPSRTSCPRGWWVGYLPSGTTLQPQTRPASVLTGSELFWGLVFR